eukprot:222582-Chlamydomonas_euryale.AAC.2
MALGVDVQQRVASPRDQWPVSKAAVWCPRVAGWKPAGKLHATGGAPTPAHAAFLQPEIVCGAGGVAGYSVQRSSRRCSKLSCSAWWGIFLTGYG